MNPFATFTEAINIDFLVESVNRDFISIKVGDVSGNAIANSFIADSRSNTSLAFNALDQDIAAGDVVSVTFGSDEFTNMNAFQFTLNVSGLEFTGVRSGAIEMKEENVAVFGDALTAAWTNVNATTASNDLFTLEFRAITDTRLSNAISMGSSRTDARAYNSDLESFEDYISI